MGIIVKANSGIKSLADLRGKKVGVSPNSSSLYATTEEVFKGYGMTFNDIRVYQGGVSQQAQMLKDGNIDAMTMTLPESAAAPGVVELATTEDIKIIPIEDTAMKIITAANPFYVKGAIPEKYVRGVDAPVQTIKIGCVFFTSTALSDDAVYQIVKGIFDNKAELEAASPAWVDTNKKTAAVNCPVPLHSGAEKYYRENGFPISFLP
jgi:TRAP transporter TAXI family solute receptor